MLTNLGDLPDRNQDPAKPALIDCLDWERPREYTHGQIDALADACARGLLTHGLRRGDAVAILSANRVEFLVAYFGIMRAGLVAVPVKPDVSSDEALGRHLDARPLSVALAERDAIAGRVQQAIERAAKLMEPKLLRNEEDVNNWLVRQKTALLQAHKDGPVLTQ